MGSAIDIVIREEELGCDSIRKFLSEIDKDFKLSLSSKVSLDTYAEKLNSKATFILAVLEEEVIGMAAFYANDPLKKESYLPIIGMMKKYRGQGIAHKMMNTLTSYLRKKGYEKLSLETWQGSPAQNFYQKNRFIVNKVVDDRNGAIKSVKMFRWLGEIDSDHDSYYTSELEYHKELSNELCIDLFIKRDDLYPKFGGGNKARKLDFILSKARNTNCNALVTAGGAQSNHCRATALYAASLGWKAILIIHDDKFEKYEGNLKLMELSGAEIRFVKQADVKEAMDNAMSDLETEGYKPYYIWGGGHSVEGALAFYEAVKELRSQLGNTIPDYLVVASGTGTTQAGLEIGIRQFYPKCQVIGVSVAREEKRGKEEILKSMRELNEYLNNLINLPDTIIFDTNKCGVGYETVFPELIEAVREAVKKGLVLDPTYTGKAFYAMKSFIEEGKITANSNVVFWHTGGLMNLLSSSKI